MSGHDVPSALYRLLGDADLLLYIGISDRFGRRWHQHAQSKPWWPEVRRQAIDWHPSREAAEAAEEAAIKAEMPRYNIIHNGRPREAQPTTVPAYTPEQAAAIIGGTCKASWLKQLARERKIPYLWIGKYSFTDAHIDEILALCEVPARTAKAAAPAPVKTAKRKAADPPAPLFSIPPAGTVQLRAREPRNRGVA